MNPPINLEVVEHDTTISPEKFDDESQAFVESFGYQVDDHGSNGWIRLGCSVGKHSDDFGKCFVYCGEGSGTLKLYYPRTKRPFEVSLTKGKRCVFNDRYDHEFILTSKSCTLLIATVKSKKKIEGGKNGIQNW